MTDSRAQSNAPQTREAPSGPPEDLIEVARIVGAHGVRGWVKLQPFSGDSTVLDSVKTWWLSAPRRTLDQVRKPSLPPVSSPSVVSGDSTIDPSQGSAVGNLVAYRVVWSKVHGSTWLACLKGLVDRDQAHALKGASVWVSRRAFPKLDDDEYYWVDLIGCEVFSADAQSPLRVDTSEQSVEDNDLRVPTSVSVGQEGIALDWVSAPHQRLGIVDSVEENPAHPLLSVLRQKQNPDGQWSAEINVRGNPVHTLIPFVGAHVLHVDLDARRIIVDWPTDF